MTHIEDVTGDIHIGAGSFPDVVISERFTTDIIPTLQKKIEIGSPDDASIIIGGHDFLALIDSHKQLEQRIDVLEAHVTALLEASTLPD